MKLSHTSGSLTAKRSPTRLLLCTLASAALSGCATQPTSGGPNTPGFFAGILHGMVSPYSTVAGAFYDLRVFAFPNSGFSYDLGFMVGIFGLITLAFRTIPNDTRDAKRYRRLRAIGCLPALESSEPPIHLSALDDLVDADIAKYPHRPDVLPK